MPKAPASAAMAALVCTVLLALTISGPSSPDPEVRLVSGGQGRDDTVRPVLPKGFQEQDRPNVVVIMADDMRDDDLVYMPNARRLLAATGVRFANSFSPHPLCCPARASFLSGQYTHNHHVWSNRGQYGFQAFDDSTSVAIGLAAAGYNTLFVGKYLNGYGRQPTPDGSPSTTYVPPGWTDWRGSTDILRGYSERPGADSVVGGTYRYFDTTLNVNGVLQGNQGRYQTRMLGSQSADLIGEYARSPRPFFLWASYVAPHIGTPIEDDDPGFVDRGNGNVFEFASPARPTDVIGRWDRVIEQSPGGDGEARMRDKPFFLRGVPALNDLEQSYLTRVTRQRAEALTVLDQQIAATMKALEATGELEDTIVALTSDNGYLLGEHRIRQGKVLPYEPSLRVPLVISGPGIPAGEVRTDPVLTIDMAPTVRELAGLPPEPTMDGESFWPTLTSGDSGWDRGILTETGPRYIRRTSRSLPAGLVAGTSVPRFTQGVRTARYLYVEHAGGERELYDVRRHPGELHSIVAKPSAADVVRKLAAELDRLRNCAGASCREPLVPMFAAPPPARTAAP